MRHALKFRSFTHTHTRTRARAHTHAHTHMHTHSHNFCQSSVGNQLWLAVLKKQRLF